MHWWYKLPLLYGGDPPCILYRFYRKHRIIKVRHSIGPLEWSIKSSWLAQHWHKSSALAGDMVVLMKTERAIIISPANFHTSFLFTTFSNSLRSPTKLLERSSLRVIPIVWNQLSGPQFTVGRTSSYSSSSQNMARSDDISVMAAVERKSPRASVFKCVGV